MSFLLNLSAPALLILSLASLAVGPLLFYYVRSRASFIKGLDGFVLVTICGLVLLHILPHTVEEIGWAAFVVVLTSLFLPTFLEKLSQPFAHTTHLFTLTLAIVGIALHAFTDGMALSERISPVHGSHGAMLPWAIVLHRIPDGLTIWWLMRPRYGNASAYRTLFIMAIATITGYFTGAMFFEKISPFGVGIFEAMVAGSLLHVIFHHDEPSTDGIKPHRFAGGIGGFAGLAVIAFFLIKSPHAASGGYLAEMLTNLKTLALESSLSLIIGYFCSGLIHTFLPRAGVAWLKKGNTPTQALRGMIFGLPLPVCSCGVVPLYRSLILRGAPIAAAMAFFVATPELGLDAFLLSFPLLGGKFTLLRLLFAAITALAVGLIMSRLGESARDHHESTAHGILDSQNIEGNFFSKFKRALKQGFIDSVDDTGSWIALGLFIAALLAPLLEQSKLLNQIPAYLQVPLFTLIGMPLYVCASGATPLAAILIYGGVSPGAGLAFLLTGPATNATTFGVLSRYHGKRTAVIFAITMALLAMCAGFGMNLFFAGETIPPLPEHVHVHASGWRQLTFAIILGLFLFSWLRRGPRELVNDILSFETDESGNKLPSHAHSHHGHSHPHANESVTNRPVETTIESGKKKKCCHTP